jgi:hypothetical protein
LVDLRTRPTPRAAVGDDERDVNLFGLQVDILDEQSEKLFANSRPHCVATFLATFAPGGRPQSHRLATVTWIFSVEAKGLEPSNLLTASQK